MKINIIMLGESGVGKTSLLLRYLHGVFKNYVKYTFVDHYVKKIEAKGQEMQVCLWDTAGQEAYKSLIKRYFRIADGVLLVYDTNNINTCRELLNWLSEFRSVNDIAEIVVAGNKSEGSSEKSGTAKMVRDFALDLNLEYMEVSAKTGENVNAIYHYLTQKILVAKGILESCEIPEGIFRPSLELTGSSVKDEASRRRISHNKVKSEVPKNNRTIVDNVINVVDKEKISDRKCRC